MKHHGLGNFNVTNKTNYLASYIYIYVFVDLYYVIRMYSFIPLFENINFFITFVQKRMSLSVI
jgi:hypothetical protein